MKHLQNNIHVCSNTMIGAEPSLWRVRMRDVLTDEVTFEYVTAISLVEAAKRIGERDADQRVPVGFTRMVPELI